MFPSTEGSHPSRHSPDDNSEQAQTDLSNKVSLLRIVLLGYLKGLASEAGKDGAHGQCWALRDGAELGTEADNQSLIDQVRPLRLSK